MFDQFQWIQGRFEELSTAVSQPEIIADQAKYQRLLKERAALEPSVEAWGSYQTCLRQLEEARGMLDDPDLGEMAQAEVEALSAQREAMERELRILLLPRDPDDDKNVVMEIRGGAGGDEASLFGAALLRMYLRYAERHGFRAEMISASMTELGGVKEAVFTLTGQGAFSRMKFESGVHRVQRVPSTESGGRIHTSTCTVAVLPQVEEAEFHLDPADLRIDTFRASGAGGQHINKTESAIRVTHLPTGTVVECQDQRSQYKNKDRALSILRARLYERAVQEQEAAIAGQRRSQVGTGMRNERIRTYNFPQGRVTDHRIGLTLYKLDGVMNGDLDELMDALALHQQREPSKGETES